jgi:cell division protease FtsH
MVCEWGMSKTMGPLTFGKREESIFLGKEFARHQDYSEATSVRIDEEIRRFVNAAYSGARSILENHRESLEAIATALLEHEVLDGERIYDLIAAHSDHTAEGLRKTQKTPIPEQESMTEVPKPA